MPDGWVSAATRTAMANGTAVNEQLFTRLSLPKTIAYRGTIVLRDGHEDLPAAVEWLRGVFALSIGGQRSTHGRVEWTVEEDQGHDEPASDRVVLRLTSPAILVDGWGAPSTHLASALAQIPGAGQVERAWSRPTQVSGWHGVAGVPKPTEWAVQTGSTAVLTDWPPEALSLVARGIGLRRLEGYGSVELVDPATLATFGAPTAATPPPVPQALGSGPLAAADTASPLEAHESSAAVRTAERVDGGAGAKQGPADGHAEPDPTGTPDPTPSDPLADLIAGLTAQNRRVVLNGTLTAARRLVNMGVGPHPQQVVDLVVQEAMGQRWCRELGPDSRQAVTEVLRSPDIAGYAARLESERGA